MKRAALARATALVLAVGVMAGCATNKQLEEIRMLAEEAKMSADRAAAAAERAEANSQEAMAMSQATDEKIDRMFKKSMLK